MPRSQVVLASISILTLILLGISSIYESQSAGERTQLLSNAETPAASIIFTQRETLVYSTQLALWSNGGTTRREVQIARALLAQRLAVIDSSGLSMGSRAHSGYWKALEASDQVVSSAPPGILPESMHEKLNITLIPIIDEIVAQARNLVVSYQRSVDREMKMLAEDTAQRDAFNLSLLYIFIISGGLFLFLNTRTNLRNFRRARDEIYGERIALESARQEVAKLQDLDAAKNALISNVNHELRTPLTSIIGYIELLQRDNPENHSREHRLHLEVLQRNSLILLNLVESLLSLSKFDGAVGELPQLHVSLRDVIEDSLFALRPAFEKADIKPIFLSTNDFYVRGDRAQLDQVLINVIANSIKFGSSNSSVTIELLSRKNIEGRDFAVITIKDEGIGIAKEEIPQIFQRFYRGENLPKDRYEGTGLGLAIVKQVIDHHGGFIEVDSEIGKGATFALWIPIVEEGKEVG